MQYPPLTQGIKVKWLEYKHYGDNGEGIYSQFTILDQPAHRLPGLRGLPIQPGGINHRCGNFRITLKGKIHVSSIKKQYEHAATWTNPMILRHYAYI